MIGVRRHEEMVMTELDGGGGSGGGRSECDEGG